MAHRPRGVPARAASTTARTAWRTSSSASETLRASTVARAWARPPRRAGASSSAPSLPTEATTAASASSAPVAPATIVVPVASPTARSRPAWLSVILCGRNTIIGPSWRAAAEGSARTAATAACESCCSLLKPASRSAATCWWILTTSAARGDCVASARSCPSPSSDSSRWARVRARSVAGWVSTPRKCPGSRRSTVRTAAAMTVMVTPRRPSAAIAAPPRRSARS